MFTFGTPDKLCYYQSPTKVIFVVVGVVVGIGIVYKANM